MEQAKRLYRSRYDTMIGGVCSGLAQYFNVDITIIRVVFVILALFAAGGVVIYIILWIAIPVDPDYSMKNFYTNKYSSQMENENKPNEEQEAKEGQKEKQKDYNKPFPRAYEKKKSDGNLIAGIVLITLGAMFLIARFVPRIDFGDLWPILLILGGILIMKNNWTKPKDNY
jgi:phage shock protein PspC (stress-responsive transcriptional regulator)